MNNQSPLIPQGSLLEQKNKGRIRVKIAVFFVLAVHGIGLMALLMQGCQKDKETSAPPVPTNSVPAFEPPTSQPAPATNAEAQTPATNANPIPEPPQQTPQTNVATPPPVTPIAPAPEATEYVIAKGDTFATLAKKFHVSVKSIAEANPGAQATKLKVGQKIHIPATASTLPASTQGANGTPLAGAGDNSGEHVYSVKSGDTLTKIATQFGTTVKVIRSGNALKTDKIKVGQKLKVPAKGVASNPTPSMSVEPANGSSSTTGAPPTR